MWPDLSGPSLSVLHITGAGEGLGNKATFVDLLNGVPHQLQVIYKFANQNWISLAGQTPPARLKLGYHLPVPEGG